MKIVIDFEVEGKDPVVYEQVNEFALCGKRTFQVKQISFRHAAVDNANDLIGQIEALKEDVKDYKHDHPRKQPSGVDGDKR